jgi:hypothetical protein
LKLGGSGGSEFEHEPQASAIFRRVAVLAAFAFSAYFGYGENTAKFRHAAGIAAWLIPALPLAALFINPSASKLKPFPSAAVYRKFRLAVMLLQVSVAWVLALVVPMLSATNEDPDFSPFVAFFACFVVAVGSGRFVIKVSGDFSSILP